MNKDNYKKAIDQIHASEELKQKTFERINQNTRKNKIIPFKKLLAACAVVTVMFSATALYLNTNKEETLKMQNPETKTISKVKKNDLPRFENIEQLKEVLKENTKNNREVLKSDMAFESVITNATSEASKEKLQEEKDYSKTNTQVENVDEADIVKTDGEYIYYVSNSKVYIIKANELKIISEIEIKDKKEQFSPNEIYINKDKLIILGNSSEYEENKTEQASTEKLREYVSVSSNHMAKAIVYDISNKEVPKQQREVGLDGYYQNSRMIGENIYFISTKRAYYYEGYKEDEILPRLKDTVMTNEEKTIKCTDIAYFKGSESNSYMLVAGFNINNNEEANIESFFGANDTIYASEKNLYIAETIYEKNNYENTKTKIYKFNLNNSQIGLQCQGEIKGNLNDQFSMDEYEGKLRIATTDGYDKKSENQLYILDENLKEIGKIENMAKGEKIYSVRFIGKTGYIVTFEQIDPLFVIDLSNPTAPVVKGELKIPGYSSYMHPYDETHIIGIGHNTKSNGYGGVTDANMKMSMFDVSNLENPKEIFNIDIGTDYASSEVLYNHKTLFYNKNKNLIGFPITYRERNANKDKNGFTIFKIDLEKGFEKYGEITQKIDYRTNIDRSIYIEDTLYTLSQTKIISYNLNTLEKITELELK